MSIAAIHLWLQSRGDFAAGVELLKLHGRPSAADLFIYGLGETSVSRQRLTTALRSIYEEGLDTTQARTASMATAHAVAPSERAERRTLQEDRAQGIQEEQLPAELRPLRRQISADFRLLSMLRGEAFRTPDGFELRQLALRIAELHDRIRGGWMVIETWRDTGTIVAFEPTKEVDQVALLKERASLRSQLSPARIAARSTPAEKVEAWRKRLAEINSLLDEPVQA